LRSSGGAGAMDGSSRWMAIDDGVLRRIRLGDVVLRTRVSHRMGWARLLATMQYGPS
jgi:hypothetical protein